MGVDDGQDARGKRQKQCHVVRVDLGCSDARKGRRECMLFLQRGVSEGREARHMPVEVDVQVGASLFPGKVFEHSN